MGRFKQLLSREGRGCRDREGQSRNNSAALGAESWFPLKGHTWQYLWVVSQILKPHQVGEVNSMLPHNTHTQDRLEPEGWWCQLPLTSPPTNQKKVHELTTPSSLNHYYKAPRYPLQVGTLSFESVTALWPPLPGKAIKLFFSTSPKTLSLRFNSVSVYRGQILHQHLWA